MPAPCRLPVERDAVVVEAGSTIARVVLLEKVVGRGLVIDRVLEAWELCVVEVASLVETVLVASRVLETALRDGDGVEVERVEDSIVEDVDVTGSEVLVVSLMDEDAEGGPAWKEDEAVTGKQPYMLQIVVVYGVESRVMVVVSG
jgi:hypothetical protein